MDLGNNYEEFIVGLFIRMLWKESGWFIKTLILVRKLEIVSKILFLG